MLCSTKCCGSALVLTLSHVTARCRPLIGRQHKSVEPGETSVSSPERAAGPQLYQHGSLTTVVVRSTRRRTHTPGTALEVQPVGALQGGRLRSRHAWRSVRCAAPAMACPAADTCTQPPSASGSSASFCNNKRFN